MKRNHWGHHGGDGDGSGDDADGTMRNLWITGTRSMVVDQNTPIKRRAQHTSQLVFDTGKFALHCSPKRIQGVSGLPSSPVPAPTLHPVLCADCLNNRDPNSMEICTHCQRLVCSYCSVRREATLCFNCI